MEMNSGILSFAVSFVIALIGARIFIPMLRKFKAGQYIREDGPQSHMTKQGTPTIGGVIFITSTVVACLISGFSYIQEGGWGHLIALALSLCCGVIGFLDDYTKVKKRQNLGLSAIQKMALQIAVSVLFIILMRNMGYISGDLFIPFFKYTLKINWIVYIIFTAFIMVGYINAVNLTDGIDGLCSGVTIPVCAFFAIVAYNKGNTAVFIFAMALMAGLIVFLMYNINPAKVFMGDTGSLFLGGAVCAMAFALDMPLVLIPVGIVYLIEAMSDIIQVAYFKLSHGKRVFKMAPIHHHFELSGWSEMKIFTVFTTVSAVACILTLFGI